MRRVNGHLGILLLLIVLVAATGCGERDKGTRKTSETPSTPEKVTPKTSGGELFVYNYGDWGGMNSFAAPGPDSGLTLNVADTASGKTAMSFGHGQGTSILISPDASMLLHIPHTEDPNKLNLMLANRETSEIIWSVDLPGKGGKWLSRIDDAVWDIEGGKLIVECKASLIGPPEGDPNNRKMPHRWWFTTLDLKTGEKVASVDIIAENATGRSLPESHSGEQYAAGKLYLMLPEFPVEDFSAYNMDAGPYPFDLYQIDPLNGAGKPLGLKSLLGQPSNAIFFVLPDASRVIFQAVDYVDSGDIRPLGGSIKSLDISNGEQATILKAEGPSAYYLHGVSTDGSKILYREYIYAFSPEQPDSGLTTSTYLLDTVTGAKTEIDINGTLHQMWLSPSGEYAAVFDLVKQHVLFSVHITSGTRVDITKDSDAGSALPTGFLGGVG